MERQAGSSYWPYRCRMLPDGSLTLVQRQAGWVRGNRCPQWQWLSFHPWRAGLHESVASSSRVWQTRVANIARPAVPSVGHLHRDRGAGLFRRLTKRCHRGQDDAAVAEAGRGRRRYARCQWQARGDAANRARIGRSLPQAGGHAFSREGGSPFSYCTLPVTQNGHRLIVDAACWTARGLQSQVCTLAAETRWCRG